MKLLVLRHLDWLTAKTTVGELFVNPSDEGKRGFECYTLEDAYLGDEVKVAGQSCIPCGDYNVRLRWSPGLKQELPVLFTYEQNGIYVIESPLKKVRFEQVMFHAGNDEGDTLGCPLVGQTRALDNSRIDFSRPALSELLQKIRAAIGRGESIRCSIRISTGRHLPQ